MIRISFLRTKCMGCNACVEAAPGRWSNNNNDGKTILLGGAESNGIYSVTVDLTELKQNLNAAINCPVGVISIREL